MWLAKYLDWPLRIGNRKFQNLKSQISQTSPLHEEESRSCDNLRPMKPIAFACLLGLWISPAAYAEETAYILAMDFLADGKVLELDIPPEIDGERFVIVFENSLSRQRVIVVPAREGKHSYEMRQFPEWRGRMKYMAVTLAGVKGRVKDPSLADNIDIFLEPQRILPSTINLLGQHRIFVRSWSVYLLVVLAGSAVFFAWFRKKPLIVSLPLGFLVAWSVMDLRAFVDHATVVYKEEKLHKGMPPLAGIKVFADRSADIIDGAWGHTSLEVGTAFLEYRLADRTYASSGSARSPVFLVTQDPAGLPVLLQHEKYYLVKKDKP